MRADILVENFAPGVMDRLGLGAEPLLALNPRLIYGSSSGYGKSGPYRDYPAMDLVMQAMCGVISVTGQPDQPPVKAGPAVCDFSAGVHLYGAIMTALFERERTGNGRVRRSNDAGFDLCLPGVEPGHASCPRRGGSAAHRQPAWRSGYFALQCLCRQQRLRGDQCARRCDIFASILAVIGRADLKDDPRFATRSARVTHMLEVDALLQAWTSQHTKEDIAERLLAVSVPCAPVRELSEVVVDRNMHDRGSLQWVDHPDLGRVVLPHSPMVFEGTPRLPLQPSATLGADNVAVFGGWLGRSEQELAALAEERVI